MECHIIFFYSDELPETQLLLQTLSSKYDKVSMQKVVYSAAKHCTRVETPQRLPVLATETEVTSISFSCFVRVCISSVFSSHMAAWQLGLWNISNIWRICRNANRFIIMIDVCLMHCCIGFCYACSLQVVLWLLKKLF